MTCLPVFTAKNHLGKSIAAVLLLSTSWGLAQGNLVPTNAPISSMKTLGQIEPRADILTLSGDSSSQFIITQPGSYYLSANVTAGSSKSGISVRTNDVFIDLKGFTIYGAGGFYGIVGSVSCSRIHIDNGRLSSWAYGVNFYTIASGTNIVLENLEILGNGTAAGIGVAVTDSVRLTRCLVSGFSGSGSLALYGNDNCVVEHCKFENNYAGVVISSHCLVTDNIFRDGFANLFAINAYNTSIIRNNDLYSVGGGIRVNDSSVVERNNCNYCSGPAINVFGNNNRIEANQTHFSSYGVQCNSGTTNFVVGNFAHGNTNANFSLDKVIAGVVVNGVGVVTNNPWANFSY